jgi:hypothetical protein
MPIYQKSPKHSVDSSVSNQDIGDLLTDIGALFYSLETVDDFTPLRNVLVAARARLDHIERQRVSQKRSLDASRTLHPKGKFPETSPSKTT